MGRLRPYVLEQAGVQLPGDVLIETGTQGGLGVMNCRHVFREIHTVELDARLYERAKRRRGCSNITFHLGDSPTVLHRIIDPTRSTVFFLDAHYVGTADSAPSVGPECPLLDELAVIFSFVWRQPPTVLIDDADMFGRLFWRRSVSRYYNRSHWPTRKTIQALVNVYGMELETIGKQFVLRAKGASRGLESAAG